MNTTRYFTGKGQNNKKNPLRKTKSLRDLSCYGGALKGISIQQFSKHTITVDLTKSNHLTLE